MQKSESTQFGGNIVNSIEYNEYPPPKRLVKAMKRKWAVDLVEKGAIRLHKLEYYHKWENEVLGDPNEGKGLFHLDRNPMEISSLNEVYTWCTSIPAISPERLALIAREGKYNCIIKLFAPEKFFERVKDNLLIQRNGFWVHCGHVNYQRGAQIDKNKLNSQNFHFNVFQKDPKFKEDMEYRMSVVNCTFHRLPEDHLDLVLGDCSDIISIEELPNF